MELPVLEIEDSSRASEHAHVSAFFAKLSAVAQKSQSREAAVDNILSETYSSVGFGPIMAVLKSYAA